MELGTDRLVIRPFVEADLDEFRRLLEIPEVEGWWQQRDNARGFLDWHIGNYAQMDIGRGIVCFGVFDVATRQVLGAAGAGEHDDLHETELFYNLLPAARGRGYATEAARAVAGWALSEFPLPYLIATVEVGNLASRRVVERCGFGFVDERALRIHVLGTTARYRYYRRYPPQSLGVRPDHQVQGVAGDRRPG